ncbi:DUF2637 domain-containing protein [Actinocrinis puniceicyclus]|uniref:DUF2637 domain-containing protein n=1 Tax=Actinocrinis puniceicyclus TaxID=977794 RepID=A0A8J7WU38_9ACTN|nr:DUF2637 domain-containing protein [Actinocrinis puniceicyclus]MBS2966017.1 DUF2637 domain-containing protein [Actinocrinis puniceicyclus]
MLHQSTSLPARRNAVSAGQPDRVSAAGPAAWIANGLLASATMILMALACASAWLSYRAQVDYVLTHNGEQVVQARVWALLLDLGTAGVSLLRLYEALRGHSGQATRTSLLGCIAASVAMNLLHAPSRTPGGYLVAAVPPVMYAVFLEHLLINVRALLMAEEQRRGLWRTTLLWINFPGVMWSTMRDSLRRDAQGQRSAPDAGARTYAAAHQSSGRDHADVEQVGVTVGEKGSDAAGQSARRRRGLGAKRLAFEAVLAEQARSGDLRLFSDDERVRNAAAYQAAASLPVPLSRGAARRYVVQALPRLEEYWPVGSASGIVLAPEAG